MKGVEWVSMADEMKYFAVVGKMRCAVASVSFGPQVEELSSGNVANFGACGVSKTVNITLSAK